MERKMELKEEGRRRNKGEEEKEQRRSRGSQGGVFSFSGWILLETRKNFLKRRKLKGVNDPQGLTCVRLYSVNSTNK